MNNPINIFIIFRTFKVRPAPFRVLLELYTPKWLAPHDGVCLKQMIVILKALLRGFHLHFFLFLESLIQESYELWKKAPQTEVPNRGPAAKRTRDGPEARTRLSRRFGRVPWVYGRPVNHFSHLNGLRKGAIQPKILKWRPLRTFHLAPESRKLEQAHLSVNALPGVFRYPGAI